MSNWNTVISKTEVYPEEWGAKGDGVTDDRAAFQAMFDQLEANPAPTIHVTLRPAVYYSIKSALNETNIFEIGVQNLIMEGPGINLDTFKYEGSATATNFFKFKANVGGVRLEEMKIVGGEARETSKIQNIIVWENSITCELHRVHVESCQGYGVTGFSWMGTYLQCVAMNCGTGFLIPYTTAFVTNCYANWCTDGFGFVGNYAVAIGCACDHATGIAYRIGEPDFAPQSPSIRCLLLECSAEDCEQAIVTKGIEYLQVYGGSFSSATSTHDYFMEFNETAGCLMFPVIGCPCDYWLKVTSGGYNTAGGNNFLVSPNIPNSKIYGYTDDDVSTPIRIAELGHYLHYHQPGDLTTFKDNCQELSSSNIRQTISILHGTATPTFTETVFLKWIKGAGSLVFPSNDPLGTITFNQSSGPGFELRDIDVPVVFSNYHFKLTGPSPLFKIKHCRLVKFLNCVFETATSAAICFEIANDDDSTIEIDKTTMEAMTTSGSGTWAGLRSDQWPRWQEYFRFTGYLDKPTAGRFEAGNKIYFFNNSIVAGYIGAVCTAGGEPGTWKYFGALEP